MSSPNAVRRFKPNSRAAASSVPTFEARDRRVARFYEGALPGFFGSARDSASAAIHLGFWEGGTRDHREAAVNANRVLASKVALRPGERVLDAGCGAGASAVWLARELGARAVGVNLSPSQIHRARRLAHAQGVSDRVSFERQDFAATTFSDESFDVVWAQESICHVEDKEPFLLEAVRLLKPGGRIVVADRFRSARPFGAEEEQLLKYWLSGWAVPDLPTAGEFVEVARQAGLSDIRIEDATAEVWPSLARMRLRALVGYPSAKALRSIGLCTDAQLAGVRAGLEQFEALGRGLWDYAIFTATKGSQDAEASYRGR
jgi:tocopherol O-methyltransferase